MTTAQHIQPVTADPAGTELVDYLVDATQRAFLFLDILRRRGDTERAITHDPGATVLWFDHELVLGGETLLRPINYDLYRILPPSESPMDPTKRPVVIVDPRAGQSAGIGGFRPQSEVGDALRAGHAVYFVGFRAVPQAGQTFLDVVDGQVAFVEHIVASHPDAPSPTAIGNCQAGYQTLMAAALRPELFGLCLVVGAPMSYWQGTHGGAPMRYLGGLLGGSWLTALASDLGHGRFDGADLILNFDALGPANFLWDKQHDLYTHVDDGADRYLNFERWWGDFILLNRQEIQYLVDNLFIGDKLTRGELVANHGRPIDLRAITSPIVVLTSPKDNISPPPQTLGWILDLYPGIDELRAAGRTIVYSADADAGHLGLFVSAKVADREDEEFVLAMDAILGLSPGLYEMVTTQTVAAEGADSAAWSVSFEPRTFDDIRAFGRNTDDDDRAFAAVAELSDITLAAYQTFVQPIVRSVANEPMAALARASHPLRLSYTAFSDANPWMTLAQIAAAGVAGNRRPVAPDNPFLKAQETISETISETLDSWRVARDRLAEQWFFAAYGSEAFQSWLSITTQAMREITSRPESSGSKNGI